LFRVASRFAIGVVVVAAALGIASGLLLPAVARGDDPPPTTVPTPTLPTPDPAPPKPKPKPKPAPKPAPRHVSTTPKYRAPVAPVPSTRPTVTPKVRAPKPKHKKVTRKAPVKKTTTVLPKISITPPVGAGVSQVFQPKSGGSFSVGSLLIVLGLSFAIACFSVAVVPATYVKWRPAAIFISERKLDLTVVGMALLVAAAFTLFVTKRP
jgi:hypothetical protein